MAIFGGGGGGGGAEKALLKGKCVANMAFLIVLSPAVIFIAIRQSGHDYLKTRYASLPDDSL